MQEEYDQDVESPKLKEKSEKRDKKDKKPKKEKENETKHTGLTVSAKTDYSNLNPRNFPHKVECNARLSNLVEINTVNGYAKVDVSIRVYWKISEEIFAEYRSSKSPIPEDDWKHWSPQLVIHNKLEGDVNIMYYLRKVQEEKSISYHVEQKTAFMGTIGHYSDLHNFPFDCGWIVVYVRSELYDANQLELSWTESKPYLKIKDDGEDTVYTLEHAKTSPVKLSSKEMQIQKAKDIVGNQSAIGSITWEIGVPHVQTMEEKRAGGRGVSSLKLRVPIKRVPYFFLWRIVFVLVIVYGFSWCTFGMDRTFGDRVNVIATVAMALVGLLFIIAQYLPQVPYLTYVDRCGVAAFGLLALTLVENYIVASLTDQNIASAIDLASIIVFPTFYLGFVVVTGLWKFHLANQQFGISIPQDLLFKGRQDRAPSLKIP